MPPRKIKVESNSIGSDPIDQQGIQFTPHTPPPTLNELNGFQIGGHYWFTYRNSENCYGKLGMIHPAGETYEASASIYDELLYQRFVSVPISALRTHQVGDKIKRKSIRPPKPKKKPIRR